MLKICRITNSDFHKVSSMKLRSEDAREIITASGIDNLEQCLRECIRLSREWTEGIFIDGECILLFGLNSQNAGIGVPWCVGSPEALNHKILLHAYSKKVVARMLEEFPMLANYVDSRNTSHIHWLLRMGFTFPKLGATLNGVWFHYFYKERK